MTQLIAIRPRAIQMLIDLIGNSDECFNVVHQFLKLPADKRVQSLVDFLKSERKEWDSELWAKAIFSINNGDLGYDTACKCGCRDDFLWCRKEEILTVSIPREIKNLTAFLSPPPHPERPLNKSLFPQELTK